MDVAGEEPSSDEQPGNEDNMVAPAGQTSSKEGMESTEPGAGSKQALLRMLTRL